MKTINNKQKTINNRSVLSLAVDRRLPVTNMERGYTLLETLVAIVILTLAIVAPMSIASKVLLSASIAREQVTAFYLAQEAIESVRLIRDQNGLSGTNWYDGLPPLSTPFSIDATSFDAAARPVVTNCTGVCPPIKYDDITHLYQYGSGVDQSFVRTITLESVPNTSDEVTITVTVSWNVGQFNRSFVARENILNWQ